MRFNLISADNGVGLSRDVELLRAFLTDRGHEAVFCHWEMFEIPKADVNVFLELFAPRHLSKARHNIGVFNLEWFDLEWLGYLSQFRQLWAKSNEAWRWFLGRGLLAIHTGFLSHDLYDPTAARYRSCLHVRGRSTAKGTEFVFEAWRRHGALLPPLTVIGEGIEEETPQGVTVIPHLEATALRHAMNANRFHLCPSRQEGWGHYITEGLSCGANVITTDASPMHEHVDPDYGILLPAHGEKEILAMKWGVNPDAIADAVFLLMRQSDVELDVRGRLARRAFLLRQEQITERIGALIQGLK